jgi:hypothetical protein
LSGHKKLQLEKKLCQLKGKPKVGATRKKEAMIRGDWVAVSRLAKSKSIHPSTGSGRTDLLLRGEGDLQGEDDLRDKVTITRMRMTKPATATR